MKKLLIVFAILFSSSFVFIAWETIVFLNSPAGESSEELLFEVRKGDSSKRVANRLEAAGFITSSEKFWLFARINKKSVRAGEYALRKTMFPSEILKTVTSGRSIERKFTVQEGLNVYEIATLLEERGFGSKEKFLEHCRDPELIQKLLGKSVPSLEGYLFPETYRLTKFTSEKQLIENMVGQYKRVYSEIKGQNKTTLNDHELVIMASIIEKETGAPEERPIISSVYHNRLKKPMRLHADPTVLYGIWVETGKFKKNLTKKDLRTKTPYNTYKIAGLPFGPIANPGKKSLLAAMQPEFTDFYYFVSRNDGTHVFSTDYASHLKAVRQYQLNRKAREGKSWRDLKRRRETVSSSQ